MNASEESNADKFASPLEGVTLESIQITLDLYRSGKAGVPVDTLWQFACPILNHYQLDLNIDPSTDVSPENVEDITLLLDVLETASMVWDYCALDSEEKTTSLSTLTQNLLGPSPDTYEAEQFRQLLGSMEALWLTLSINPASFTADESPCDEPHLLNDTTSMSTNGNAFYGPDKLDMPEAFALFSRPLFEDEHVNSDPDLLDDAMMRAQAYWDLAHTPPDQFDKQFSLILKEMGPTSLSEELVRKEALTMVNHFQTLFPERH